MDIDAKVIGAEGAVGNGRRNVGQPADARPNRHRCRSALKDKTIETRRRTNDGVISASIILSIAVEDVICARALSGQDRWVSIPVALIQIGFSADKSTVNRDAVG